MTYELLMTAAGAAQSLSKELRNQTPRRIYLLVFQDIVNYHRERVIKRFACGVRWSYTTNRSREDTGR